MNAEKALYARLTAVTGVTDLVSTRIYPVQIPQDATLPAITYRLLFAEREHAMGADCNILRAQIELLCVAYTYAETKNTNDEVRQALQRFSGTVSTFTIHDIWIEDNQDVYVDDVKQFIAESEITMWVTE